MLDSLVRSTKSWVIEHILAYDEAAFVEALHRMSVSPGDTLMVHASWRPRSGFRGKPADMIAALKKAVGEDGLLVMPSLTYHNVSSAEFLASGKPMDVRRSPSQMGLLSEVFRRTKGVSRSLSATHPLLAWGRDAEEFLGGHEGALEPFGKGSPFERLLQRNAAVLGIDAPFSTITFTHYVEAHLAPRLPFAFWAPEPLIGSVIDAAGQRIERPVRVISAQANLLRREERLVSALNRTRALKRRRIGNTSLILVRCREMIQVAQDMLDAGEYFFDPPSRAS